MDNIILRYTFDKKKMSDNKIRTGLLQIKAREHKTNKCVYIKEDRWISISANKSAGYKNKNLNR
jgi:hypothetical protein